MSLPPARVHLQRFLERCDGCLVFLLVGEGHSQCGQSPRITWIHLRSLFKNALCLRPIAQAEVQHPLYKEHVRVPGGERHRFAHEPLCLRHFVRV